MGISAPYPSTLPPLTVSKSLVVPGAIAVASGGTNYLPPFPVTVSSGYAGTLAGVRAVCRTGTVTYKIQRNGSDVTGLTGLTANQTVSNVTSTQALTDGDLIAVVVTTPLTGSPDSLSVEVRIGLA